MPCVYNEVILVVLFGHRLLDQPDDNHQDGAAHAAAGTRPHESRGVAHGHTGPDLARAPGPAALSGPGRGHQTRETPQTATDIPRAARLMSNGVGGGNISGSTGVARARSFLNVPYVPDT